ncbi:MAG: insulinase family protein [Syntrophomonadaceae bacterium]|nr:insulinase family protein [Syntrophomonadaceae bacterium]
MNVTKETINGAKVLIEELPYVRSAAVGVFIRTGSKHEPPELGGISHFIEHMLFKGTSSRSARQIAEVFEGMGGQLNAYTSKEYTCFYARVLDENIELAIEVLFDMLFDSAINQKDVENEQGVVLEEINMYEDTPDDLVHDLFAQAIFSGHSLGSSILGSEKTVSSFTAGTVKDYYRSYYHPSNMVVSVVGNVNTERILEKIADLRGYSECIQSIPEIPAPFPVQNHKLVAKDTEQVQICLGVPGISYFDQRRYVQNVMNNIIGGGMSSHLFQTIREEQGLAYSVFSYPSTYKETGTYAIYVGTSPSKVGRVFDLLNDGLYHFITEKVTADEIKRTQDQIKAGLFLGMESVMTRMNRLGKSELLYGKLVPVEEVINKVYQVTPEMVQDFARDILGQGGFTVASIGESKVLPVVEEGVKRLEQNMAI